jgi:hypothetical protein
MIVVCWVGSVFILWRGCVTLSPINASLGVGGVGFRNSEEEVYTILKKLNVRFLFTDKIFRKPISF